MRINGVIVPLLTPLTGDEIVDTPRLANLIEHTINGGVSAIFLLGSTGEGPALRPSQREELVRTASRAVARRVPLLVGVMEPGTAQAVDQARVYSKCGADAIVPTAPVYFNHSQSELATHFSEIASAVDVPVFLYNIPAMVKLSLSPTLVAKLAKVRGIMGIKDSEGNLDVFQQYLAIRDATPGFQVWQGAEPVAAMSVVRGADGVVLGLANIAPRLCTELYNSASRGDLTAAWELQARLMRLFAIQRHESWIAGLKAASQMMGLCDDKLSGPFASLNEQQAGRVRQTLSELGLLPEGPIEPADSARRTSVIEADSASRG